MRQQLFTVEGQHTTVYTTNITRKHTSPQHTNNTQHTCRRCLAQYVCQQLRGGQVKHWPVSARHKDAVIEGRVCDGVQLDSLLQDQLGLVCNWVMLGV